MEQDIGKSLFHIDLFAKVHRQGGCRYFCEFQIRLINRDWLCVRVRDKLRSDKFELLDSILVV